MNRWELLLILSSLSVMDFGWPTSGEQISELESIMAVFVLIIERIFYNYDT